MDGSLGASSDNFQTFGADTGRFVSRAIVLRPQGDEIALERRPLIFRQGGKRVSNRAEIFAEVIDDFLGREWLGDFRFDERGLDVANAVAQTLARHLLVSPQDR